MAGCSLGNSKRSWLHRKVFHLFPRHFGENRGTELPLKWHNSRFLWFVRLHERVLPRNKCVLTTKMIVTITKTICEVEICNRLSDRSGVYYCNSESFAHLSLRIPGPSRCFTGRSWGCRFPSCCSTEAPMCTPALLLRNKTYFSAVASKLRECSWLH